MASDSQFYKLEFDEIQDVYKRLNTWIRTTIATKAGNHEARLQPFAKCNTKGSHLTGYVYGINSFDYDLNEDLKQVMNDKTAKITSEAMADGTGFIYTIQAKIKFLKSERNNGLPRRTRAGPTLTIPLILMGLDVVLCYALYWKATQVLLL